MRLNNYKIALLKGICNGIALVFMINISVIASLCTNVYYGVYWLMGFALTAIASYLFLNSKRIGHFLITCIIGILVFVIIESVLIKIGIIQMAFKHIYGASEEMSPGTGLGIMFMIMFNLIGSLLGTIVAFVNAFIKQRDQGTGYFG